MCWSWNLKHEYLTTVSDPPWSVFKLETVIWGLLFKRCGSISLQLQHLHLSSAGLESGLPCCMQKLFSTCILPYPPFLHISIDIFPSVGVLTVLYPPNCWHGSPFTQKFLQLCTCKRCRPEQCWSPKDFPFFHFLFFWSAAQYGRQGKVPQWETDFSISGLWVFWGETKTETF